MTDFKRNMPPCSIAGIGNVDPDGSAMQQAAGEIAGIMQPPGPPKLNDSQRAVLAALNRITQATEFGTWRPAMIPAYGLIFRLVVAGQADLNALSEFMNEAGIHTRTGGLSLNCSALVRANDVAAITADEEVTAINLLQTYRQETAIVKRLNKILDGLDLPLGPVNFFIDKDAVTNEPRAYLNTGTGNETYGSAIVEIFSRAGIAAQQSWFGNNATVIVPKNSFAAVTDEAVFEAIELAKVMPPLGLPRAIPDMQFAKKFDA